MLVILNSIDYPQRREMAQRLACRFEAGFLVDLYDVKADLRTSSGEIIGMNEVFVRAADLVRARKQKDMKAVGVLSSTFDTAQALRQLRMRLSADDNEIYAFRLPLTDDVLGQEKQIQDAYRDWFARQEEGAQIGDMGYVIRVRTSDPAGAADALWNDIHQPVELREYDEQWPRLFAQEQALILEALGGMACEVEHIGSTALPGMSAKPIIDILITVRRFADARSCIQPLRRLGYAFIDYPQNTDRLFFRKGTPRSHHLHLVEQSSSSARNHLDFRDALLANPAACKEYRQLKVDGLRKYQQRRALYGERKTAFIQRVLEDFRAR